jgi:hypothetical protein
VIRYQRDNQSSDNTMAKRKSEQRDKYLQNTTQKTTSNTNLSINWQWKQAFLKFRNEAENANLTVDKESFFCSNNMYSSVYIFNMCNSTNISVLYLNTPRCCFNRVLKSLVLKCAVTCVMVKLSFYLLKVR